jgi:predicted permease
MNAAPSVYRALLWCYPAAFRQEYGGEMLLMFADQLDDARRSRNRVKEAALWLRAATDVLTIAPKEHYHVIWQDVRYALRGMLASPGFALVAILSLALGIGANTALFSLWNGVLVSTLRVRDPGQLVILTNPNASGVSIGSQTGERALLTYAEFEQLRDHVESFSGLMASQSSLERLQVRVGNSDWEEATGRLVSGEYFDVLGVTAAFGRTFTAADDRSRAPYVVISHDYWQRRFAGQPDVVGKTITVRKVALTIVGVGPASFSGETSGEKPELWIPLQMQPGVLPGRDWLHDKSSEKVMWLHAFGRLKPGVSIAQAEARANGVFKSALEAHYGTHVSAQALGGFLDQRLTARPAAAGASAVRNQLSEPLKVLLAAVGVLLLIACANLANLLLARGAARQKEIVLRLSLGASRVRLVRQLLTESLVLALCGGMAGLFAAYLFHRGLVRMITQTAERFQMGFDLEPRVLGFSIAVTVASAIVFGVLPAWLSTRADAGDSLKGQGRTSTNSGSQLRWGRVLVALQLALSLPLLAGAGLLIRTLHNLQQADLGFAREGLAVVSVDAQTAGYELNRREPLFRELLYRIQRIPGVRVASFSENGLFSGYDSGDEIEVEGYTRTGRNDRGSRWDQVGPGYFSTLGVPVLLGREITADDQAGSPKVCVINESFAKQFFAGRNPLGMHITTIYGDRRLVHEIVGVVKDYRTHRVRGNMQPRYFAPITQPLGEYSAAVFEIRTTGAPGPVLSAVRKTIRDVDGTLPILRADIFEDRLASRMAQDRIMARLATAFGVVAILLAAIGLYGVLSYGTARRQGEIGIRIALGAEPRNVVRMILGETSGVLIAGLIIGGGLAYAAGRLLSSYLFGLPPHDPATMAFAVAVLLIVALAAAYLPARRASRLDPMAALRQE